MSERDAFDEALDNYVAMKDQYHTAGEQIREGQAYRALRRLYDQRGKRMHEMLAVAYLMGEEQSWMSCEAIGHVQAHPSGRWAEAAEAILKEYRQ